MLERIANIETKNGFKGSRKATPYEKFLRKPFAEKEFGKDSIVFSPAAVFLSSIGWQLKEVSYPSQDKVKIVFFISDFEFETVVDLVDFYQTTHQSFKVTQNRMIDGKAGKVMVDLSVKKPDYTLPEEQSRTLINSLKELFGRISDMRIYSEFDRLDSTVLNTIIDGIETKLVKEFDEILKALYLFVNKLGKFKIASSHQFEQNYDSPITIEKINTVFS